MIWLYRLLFFPAILLASPHYLRRMLRRGGYGANFQQRFGLVPELPPRRPGIKRIWVQAVSVGEMLAIGPLLQALHVDADVEIYLTTTTSTGYKLAIDRYPQLVMSIGYFPIDGFPFSSRAWKKIDPDMAIVTEGERWPEHIHQARRRRRPVICVNARMSDRGYMRMKKAQWLVRSLFDGITRFLPCSRQDADRLRDLGFSEGRIAFVGNIKLDIDIAPIGEETRRQLRRELGVGGG
ncbi:MAG: glycosyltransferase N-terminal domain-containing protein, partial [Opitutaceae bacterium]